MKLSHAFSGALRTFAYFLSSGTHYLLEDLDYLSLYGEEPSAIEMVYSIYVNVLELDENGELLNRPQRPRPLLRADHPSWSDIEPTPTAGPAVADALAVSSLQCGQPDLCPDLVAGSGPRLEPPAEHRSYRVVFASAGVEIKPEAGVRAAIARAGSIDFNLVN